MNNKFNIKTAFAIILIIIFVIGAYLLFRTPKNGTDTTNVGDKGFLSFFGNRDTKPVDETTVPGAKTGNKNNTGDLQTGGGTNGTNTDDGSNSNGNGTGGNNTGGSNGNNSSNTNGSTAGNANGNGSLSIKSIGTNPNSNGGGSNGTGGVGGSSGGNSGNNTGGFNGGTNGSGGNSGGNTGSNNGNGTGGSSGGNNGTGGSNGTGGPNSNPNNPTTFVTTGCPANNPNCNVVSIPTIDCTPPKLPYTDTEIAQLKTLVARFYNISAGLKTKSDIQNEIDTRESYIELINKANGYTNQCLLEIKAVKDGTNVKLLDGTTTKLTNKAIDNNPRYHPYLPAKLVSGFTATAAVKTRLRGEISAIKEEIAYVEYQTKFLERIQDSRKISLRTPSQESLLIKLRDDHYKLVLKLQDTEKDLQAITDASPRGLRLLPGTFFPELGVKNLSGTNKKITNMSEFTSTSKGSIVKDYMADNMVPKRLNDDWDRRVRIFFMISDRIWATSNFWNTEKDGKTYPWAQFYFFQGTAQSEQDNPLQWMLNDKPHILGGSDDDPNASGVKNFHRLQQIENALGVW
jgi:hypothetical protein